ncbi:glycosyltransferase family 2 protein [Salinimicrobium sediminilitoris]|uniref:glycosyltransferase family 2 protein n=1 Tax=Salinimicrobium sediminilitoris TaxID=2876715 RepID=UPI001E32F3C5|nr:glycosyltransferase family 2 protein [Salinimicrobium sediminilitoris]MCC8358522.1 glycosyltransferase family 2 protein [Salinimicrobium sediminilitoris]
MSTLISVILPVYNREAFVGDAIQSILNQTYQNFELIVIDDGSTDSTLEVVKSFNDHRIKILRNKSNTGVSASRNSGIKEAKGEFVAFMDSDDISAPERLWKQLRLLQQKPEIEICGSWLQFLNSDKIIKHQEEHDDVFTQLLLNCSLSLGAVMYNRIFRDLLLDERLQFGEDYELWSRVGWKSRFYNIQEPLLFYRTHQDQISGRNKQEQLSLDAEIRLSLYKKLGYCQESFPDEVIKKIILFREFFDLKEFRIFLDWLRVLEKINLKKKIFPHAQLEKVLMTIKQDLLFNIFFSNSDFGIDKRWRVKALRLLDKEDLLKILELKFRQYIKIYSR